MIATKDTIHPLPLAMQRRRNLPVSSVFNWLGAGWNDLWTDAVPSLAYGFMVFLISVAFIAGLLTLRFDYILFPVLAGFMVIGPMLAAGLYQKSRDKEDGRKVSLSRMIFIHPASGAQIWYAGVILCLLMLIWLRAAVILYALFFGLSPFPGIEQIVAILTTTWLGWCMIAVGTAIGGLFAAFSFALGAFSIPMLLDKRTDVFTAMGTSISLVWNNLPVMLAWGGVVLFLFLLCLATGLLGLIIIFPWLGHSTWHSYRAIMK